VRSFAMLVPVPSAVPAGQGDDPLAEGGTAFGLKWPTEEVAYDITIVLPNLPKADASPRT